MDIVQISAELAPIAKVGGLGDVLLGLSKGLIDKGKSVEIILPKYDCLNTEAIEELEVEMHDLPSYFEGKRHHNSVWKGKVHGIPIKLIEPHDPHQFFERQTIYGCPDDILRFCYFCRASLEYLVKTNRKPDIVHVHDWHAALIPLLLREEFAAPLGVPKTVLTIHNLAYQGLCSKKDLEKVGINPKEFDSPDRLQDLSNHHDLNLLQGGIVYADYVTTVSSNYAKEALTPEGGKGLEKVLQAHKEKFSGILNGIDYEYWNPETDPFLPVTFSLHSLTHKKAPPYIEEKEQIKQHLRRVLSLKNDENSPLVGCVTRLVHQKGPELIKHALLKTLEKGGQFILIGTAAEEKTHTEFYNLKRKLAESRHVHIELNYNEPLAHLIYAASDLFLVPSLFEPCGLTQMIAMRYGCVPLVRKTGGLADTVFDGKNGFTFTHPTAEGILPVLEKALTCWFEDPGKWHTLIHNGMKADFSWKVPSNEYLKIYKAPHDAII